MGYYILYIQKSHKHGNAKYIIICINIYVYSNVISYSIHKYLLFSYPNLD